MAPKVFITGATGYVGGDALYVLYNAHPDWSYTALVRSSEKAAPLATAFPKLHFVYGDMDDVALIEEEAKKADIVLHTANALEHSSAATAIASGLSTSHTPSNPGYWLHVSGTGSLTLKDFETRTFGEPPSSAPYDDLEGVSELFGLPDTAFHQKVNKMVLAAGSERVKTAIIAPPTIYGLGRGAGNQRSRQAYNLAKYTLRNGRAPRCGRGLTEWDNVHIHDVSNLFLLLAERAMQSSRSSEDDNQLWNEKGYYLVENGQHHVWGEVSQWIADVAFEKGYIQTKELEPMDWDKAMQNMEYEAISWGLNSRGHAKRARKFLGWVPRGTSLREEIPVIVKMEARDEGLVEGYKAKDGGNTGGFTKFA